MGEENAERKSGDLLKKSNDKGKGILMYQRKKSRKDARNDIEAMEQFWSSRKNKGICIREEAAAAGAGAGAVSSKQQAPSPPPQEVAVEPPEETTIDWADANSGHLLTCACRVCTGAVPTPLFRSNIIDSSPRRLADSRPLHAPAAVPVYQPDRIKPHPGPFRKAKVYPSVVIPPSNQNLQKPHREISLPAAAVPKLEDISFIELLASGEDMGRRASSQPPSISFMEMLQKGDQTLPGKNAKVATADCNYNLQLFLESTGQMSTTSDLSNNYFLKMLMEEEGIDDEKLLMEVKQELMIREVDAYACLLRKQNLDFGKLMMTTKNCSR